jgi:hypothetical protein
VGWLRSGGPARVLPGAAALLGHLGVQGGFGAGKLGGERGLPCGELPADVTLVGCGAGGVRHRTASMCP